MLNDANDYEYSKNDACIRNQCSSDVNRLFSLCFSFGFGFFVTQLH